MRIIECYIENFGKICKRKFEFKEGLNCISSDNGTGKTTLAAFIKAMLYGMSDTKKMSLEENDRKHYLPWQGGLCGGSLTFSAGSKTYRIERSFAPKATDDTYTLYDTATGRVCEDFSEALGEELFGIDADGFERTVFLSERALTPKSDNKSISAKLSDLVGCDGDIGGMDEAMKVLENQRKFYYKKGGSGELSDTKTRIDEITRRLDSLSEVEIALESTHKKMLELAEKTEKARACGKDILNEREALTLKAAEVNFEKRCSEIRQELEENTRKRTAVGEMFSLSIPSFKEIDEASYKATEARNLLESTAENDNAREFNAFSAIFDGKVEKEHIENARAALSALKANEINENDPRVKRARKIFSGRIPTEEEISGIERLLAKEKRFPMALISYIPFTVLCVIGVLLEQTLIAVGVLGIVATLIIELILKDKAKRKKKAKLNEFFSSVSGVTVSNEDEAKERLADMVRLLPLLDGTISDDESDRLNGIITSLTVLFPEYRLENKTEWAEEIIADYDKYAELTLAERYIRGDREARRERSEKLKRESEAFLERYKTKTDDPFSELRAGLTEYNRLTAEIVAKRDELARLESQHRLGEDNHKRTLAEIDALDKRRAENDRLIAELSREYTLAERAYNSYTEELDCRDELYMRRAELEDTLKKHKDNYDTLLLTKKYITLAKDNMTSRYLGKTKAGFLKYTEIIGGITGESFEMDTDFSVTKQEGASTRSVEAYSRGTRDLFNLAARLALVDSLYEGEKPFIILDDPFTAFDDGKIKSAIKLMQQFAKDRQVIYFTCSKSRSIQA